MSTLPSSSHGKSWWSRSKSAKDGQSSRSRAPTQDDRPSLSHSKSRDNIASSKFNNFVANAIGKKSKKPTLTIQDPPSPLLTASLGPISYSTPNTAVTTPAYSPAPFFTARPPAKSVSTVRSYEYDDRSDPHTISEPRTPSDHPRDRRSYQNSVLTLSDPDPFAAGAMIVPHLPQDPNRLSVYSDSSMLDPHSAKRGDMFYYNRMSYGSSSSNSHGTPSESQSPRSPVPPSSAPPLPRSREMLDASGSKRHRRETSVLPDNATPISLFSDETPRPTRTHAESTPSRSAGAPAERTRKASEVHVREKQPMRPRGKTVGGGHDARPVISVPHASGSGVVAQKRLQRQASDQLRSDSPATSAGSPIMFSARSSLSNGSTTPQPSVANTTRPLVVVRKASSSRVNLPPLQAAPPSSQLPPPPLSPFVLEDDAESLVFPEPPSSSSSSLSCMSTEFPSADEVHHFMLHGDDEFGHEARVVLGSPLRQVLSEAVDSESISSYYTGSRGLTRAASQQSLSGRRVSEASFASITSSNYDDPVSPSSPSPRKAPRKQRSFHHPRLPMPPLPSLWHANTSASTLPPDASSGSRPTSSGMGSPPQQRRRLFSGSSSKRISLTKRSSSPAPTVDDDLRSLLSSFSADGVEGVPRDVTTQARPRHLMSSFGGAGGQLSLSTDNLVSSPADENPPASSTPNRCSTSEYVPQHIMSPAEMLKLEEQLESSTNESDRGKSPKLDFEPKDVGLTYVNGSSRPRTNSLLSNMSTGTMAFGEAERSVDEVSLLGALTRPPLASPARWPAVPSEYPKTQSPRRPSTATVRTPLAPPVAARPSTAQPSLASPPISPTTSIVSPIAAVAGLPPPPRFRQVRHSREDSDSDMSWKRTSMAPVQPLSPPPRSKSVRSTTTHQSDETGETAGATHPPSSFNAKRLNRRSIMRKPSFLDIDDDDGEEDEDAESMAPLSTTTMSIAESIEMECSFLDLDKKDSFDTVRSFDEPIRAF